MRLEKTPLEDCFILHEEPFIDDRGYFVESFNKKTFKSLTGLDIEFVQDNQSMSSKGVLRGLHLQTGDSAQAKLVRVLKGKVLDVAVDLRKSSKSFGQYFSIELTDQNRKQLFIPAGFAHGFIVLSKTAIFSYKVDKFYSPGNELGIIYNDEFLNIDWILPKEEIRVSEKDLTLKSFKEVVTQLKQL